MSGYPCRIRYADKLIVSKEMKMLRTPKIDPKISPMPPSVLMSCMSKRASATAPAENAADKTSELAKF